MNLKPLYLLAISLLISTASAWNPTLSYGECARVARYTNSFHSPQQFERWKRFFNLTEVASGRIQVHTRLRICGELGYEAGQNLIKLTAIEMGKLYEQATARMPDYHLGMSYTYTRAGPETPLLALDWASGARVNTVAQRYIGTEQARDRLGQTLYNASDIVAVDRLGFRVSGVLSFVFGSSEWENEIYAYRFDLSGPANIERLAGEPVQIVVRNSHGNIGNRSFSFASFN